MVFSEALLDSQHRLPRTPGRVLSREAESPRAPVAAAPWEGPPPRRGARPVAAAEPRRFGGPHGPRDAAWRKEEWSHMSSSNRAWIVYRFLKDVDDVQN